MYYDGYRFSSQATEGLFNSDMVLYFLRELATKKEFPRELLDRNVRTAYEHLGHVGAPGRLMGQQPVLQKCQMLEALVLEAFGMSSNGCFARVRHARSIRSN